MRKLNMGDIFEFAKVLRKIDLKEDIKKIAKDADNAADVWSKGFDLIWVLFEKACDNGVEQLLFKFFAGPFQCKWEEVRDMGPLEFAEGLKEIADADGWRVFFQSVAKKT